VSSGFDTTLNRTDDQSGFALLMVLLFVMISILAFASVLSISQNTASLTTESVSTARLRSSVISGIDYAESKLRPADFDDVLKGMNHLPDADLETAGSIHFRNPISRARMMESEWNRLGYSGADDGLFYANDAIANQDGLELNGCRLFFKVVNNSDDPGGPFQDKDDCVLVRVAGVTPLPAGFLSFRKIRNISEIVEVQLRRNSTFLGPAAIYAPTGSLVIDLSAGGVVDGLSEVSTGAAIATGADAADVRLNSPEQLRGNPVQMDLSDRIQSDSRMRWLADPAFVEHWRLRISDYAAAQSVADGSLQTYWFPTGVELSGNSVIRGVVFSPAGVTLSGSATLEGLLVLLDSATVGMQHNSRIRGGIVVVGNGQVRLTLTGQTRVEYSPGLIMQAIKLLPLSRTRFRYILPGMQ
jgi:hypothetical protein